VRDARLHWDVRFSRRIARCGEVSLDGPAAGGDGSSLLDRLAAGAEDAGRPHDARWQECLLEEALRRMQSDPAVEPRTLEVFRAYAVEGVDAAEVARRFGLKENAVYQIKNRMGRRIKAEVALVGREIED
jgi:hypothetical protein